MPSPCFHTFKYALLPFSNKFYFLTPNFLKWHQQPEWPYLRLTLAIAYCFPITFTKISSFWHFSWTDMMTGTPPLHCHRFLYIINWTCRNNIFLENCNWSYLQGLLGDSLMTCPGQIFIQFLWIVIQKI